MVESAGVDSIGDEAERDAFRRARDGSTAVLADMGAGGATHSTVLDKVAPKPLAAEADDFAGDTTTVGVLPIGGSVSGVFETGPEDVDWFAVTLTAGQHLEVTGTWWLPAILFFDASGNRVPPDFFTFGDAMNSRSAGFTAAASGTYYIGVTGQGTGSTYILSAKLGDGNNPANLSNLPVLADGPPISGQLVPGERDLYAVSLQAGEGIEISSDAQLVLYVFDQYGEQYFRVGGSSSNINFTAPSAGTYYISAASVASPPRSVSYQIDAYRFRDDFPGSRADSVILDAEGDLVEGALNYSADQDWFRIDLTAYSPVSIKVIFDDPAVTQVTLELMNMSNSQNVAFGIGASSAEVVYAPSGDGAFDFRVHSPSGFLGSYRVVVTPFEDQNSPSNPVSMELGQFIEGTFDYINDQDRFLLEGTAGQSVKLEITDPSVGAIRSDPVLRGPDGEVVAAGFASRTDEFYLFDLPATGTYTLDMRGVGSFADPQDYAFQVTQASGWQAPSALAYLYTAGARSWIDVPDPGATPTVTPNGPFVGGAMYDQELGQWLDSTLHTVVGANDVHFRTDGQIITNLPYHETTLVNNGVLWSQSGVQGSNFIGAIAVGGFAWDRVTNNGVIVAIGYQSAFGVRSATDGTFVNNGDVHVHATAENGFATGVQLWSGGADALPGHTTGSSNSGLVTVHSARGNARGFLFANDIDMVNSGDIVVSGFIGAQGVASASGGRFVNSGSIVVRAAWDETAFDHANLFFGVGVDSGANIDITNSGLISASAAINVFGRLRLVNEKGGEIDGAVLVNASEHDPASSIINRGLISGDIFFGDASDTFDSSAGVVNGLVFLAGGKDTAIGGVGFDYLIGEGGADSLSGGEGDDVLEGGAGNDTINGGGGFDVASYLEESAGVTVSLGLAGAQATGGSGADTLVGIEALEGSLFNDALTGDANNNILDGLAGDDTLNGGAGDDVLVGGSGGVNVLNGGDGRDMLGLADATGSLFVDLAAGVFAYAGGGWDALTSIEGIIGGAGIDTLFGDAGGNVLRGGDAGDTLVGRDGDDALIGEGGNDWIVGDAGDDLLEGGVGINVLIGGAGVDLASYASATGALWVDMNAGVYSAVGVWDVFFESIEGVLGGSGNDSIFGNGSANTLRGGAGADALLGNAGDDRLEGGDGQDWIVGGDGNDRLIGGTNDVDVLSGGAGADTFDLGTNAGWDVAFDFNTGEDRFALGGQQWLGFVTYDADGDGQEDDTLLGYAGGNFVALNVSGLTLAQWNALVDAPEAIGKDADPIVLAETGSELLAERHNSGAGRLADANERGFRPETPVLLPDDAGGWDLLG